MKQAGEETDAEIAGLKPWGGSHEEFQKMSNPISNAIYPSISLYC